MYKKLFDRLSKYKFENMSKPSIGNKIEMIGCNSIQSNSSQQQAKLLGTKDFQHLNRYWENGNCNNTKNYNDILLNSTFTIMSYNILSQNLLTEHSYLYPQHNPEDLKWEKRWNNIFNEICQLAPDIMCLQEVQESYLKDYFTKLESQGYQGIYKKRTGIRLDGCAIYYKTDKFKLIEYETIEFYQPNISILNRDNIAIIAKFQFKNLPDKDFIVATTHLLYNPKREDVRLAQVQLFIAEVERLSFIYNRTKIYNPGKKDSYLPIIITGDFNAMPDSTVYKFITNGSLQYKHLLSRSLAKPTAETNRCGTACCQGNILIPHHLGITDNSQHATLLNNRVQNPYMNRLDELSLIKLYNSDKNSMSRGNTSQVPTENTPLFGSGTISHTFAFKSVYNHGQAHNIEATTFQDRWISVDYIFYSGKKDNCGKTVEDKIHFISRYRLPCEKELDTVRLPNTIIGSDHLSLMVKLSLV